MSNGTPDSLAALGAIGIIGSGAVGGTLARALAAVHGSVATITALHPAHAESVARQIQGCRAVATPDEVVSASTTVLLAVPDDAIMPLARHLHWSPSQRVVHLSGASGTQALAEAAAQGASVAALHPLMTFTPALATSSIDEIRSRLRGCVWALETADPALGDALRRMVEALGGRIARLAEEDRIPYHISGVLASNFVVTLMGAAVALWESFGADGQLAREALLPLMRAAVENLEAMEPPAALSGPIARGDVGTLHAHLDWLATHAQGNTAIAELREAYVALARLALPLAEEKGTLAPDAAAALHALLDDG